MRCIIFLQKALFIYNRRHPYNRIYLEYFADEPSRKLSIVEQFHTLFGTESKGNAGDWDPKRRKNKMDNTKNVGWILHPILHRKFSINKGNFKDWCRNVGEKQKTFFGEDRFRKWKTSDFFEANLRTFEAKHRNFSSKMSDVFRFRNGCIYNDIYKTQNMYSIGKFLCYITNKGKTEYTTRSQKAPRREKRTEKRKFCIWLINQQWFKQKRLFFVKMPDFLP